MAQITTALRYPGGKSKALSQILPVFKDDFIEYREPFVGGGSVFIAARQNKNPLAIYKINDLNKELYCFWKYLKEDAELLIQEIVKTKLLFPNGKKLFEYYRRSDIKWDDLELAARFFILNRITFSGNVSSGGYSEESYTKRFTESSINRLRLLSPLLFNVKITNDDYTKLLFEKGNDVFIYLDPPYYSNARDSKFYGNNSSTSSFRYFQK
jgi:DNA adenine methylase